MDDNGVNGDCGKVGSVVINCCCDGFEGLSIFERWCVDVEGIFEFLVEGR